MTSCTSIQSGYCGSLCLGGSGGIDEVFVTNQSNIDTVSFNNVDESVSDITLSPNTHWYFIKPNIESSNWQETIVDEETNGVHYYEQSITVVIGATQQATRNLLVELSGLPLAFIILDDNGRYWYFDNQRLDGGQSESGVQWTDLNGLTMEFFNKKKEPIFEADVEHSTNLKQDLEDAKNPNPPVQPEHYIHYVSSVPLSGVWIDTNTDSRFNTWDDSTGDGYVYIYDGVTTIGGSNSDDYSPFHNNSNVTLIDITNTEFTTIGDFAFRGCSNLTDFAYGENITSFGNYCFYQCESIPNFEFSDSVESIGQYAFYGCSELEDVSIGTGIENISSDAFSYTALTSFDVPSTITAISPFLLRGTPITSITIPDNILSVGRYAFADCSLLTTATIGNGVENIHASAFENCTSLQNLTIGDSVEMISNSAFEDCSTLDELTLPDTLAIIGTNTFYGCNSLMDVYIERDTPPSLANNNFTAIGDTLHVPYSLLDTYENNTAWRNAFTFIRPDGYSYVNVVAGENGSTSGSGWYLIGSTITISATADSHYHFTTWNDGDTNATRSITVGSSDVTFTASFAIDRFLLNVGVNDSDYGSASGTGYYDYGTQVTISATPNEHYHFTQWQDGDVTNPRTVTVTSNMTFVATLAIDTFVLTVNTDSSYGSTTGSGTYAYGTQVQIEATPNEHYHFTAWNDGVATNPRTVTVTADATYTASIAIDTFTLTVESDDIETGSTDGSGTYAYGTPVNIYAYPESGYYFANWQDGNTSPTRTIVVTGNETYTAYFALEVITYNVILDVNDPDWGGVSGDGAYDDGQEYTIEAQPSEGYVFEYWEDGGGNPIYDNPYTDYINGGDVYYMAYFAVRGTTPIHYNSTAELSNTWITNNTNTSLNEYDSSTGDGTLYVYDDVTTIGGGQSTDYSPFYGNLNLISVDMSDSSISDVSTYVFGNCSNLTSAVLPDGITEISRGAFNNCTSLTSVTIPDTVTTIKSSAFDYCSSLASITLPSSITTIEDFAFNGCNSLMDVYCEATTVPTLGSQYNFRVQGDTLHVPYTALSAYQADSTWRNAFTNIVTDDRVILYHNFNNTAVSGNWVTNNTDTARNTYDVSTGNGVLYLNNGVTTLGGGTGTSYSPFYSNNYIDSVDLQYSGLTTLGTYAFRQTYISSLTIPASVTSVSDSIISQAPVILLTVDASNNVYDSRNNCNAIIDTTTNTLVVGCNNSTIPNTVTSIGMGAFMYCTALQTITIPSSVTSIYDSAFYRCTSLTSIIIPSGITVIESEVFGYCSSLTSVTIPNTVTTIYVGAFRNCSSLASITIPSSVTSIQYNAFGNCNSLMDVNIETDVPPTIGTNNFTVAGDTLWVPTIAGVSAYRANNDWNSKFTNIETHNAYIAYNAGTQATGNWVTNNTDTARNTYDVSTGDGVLYFDSSVLYIGGNSTLDATPFYQKSDLNSVDMSNTMFNAIWYYAFDGCSSLTSVLLPDTLLNINVGFGNCTALPTITIPSSVIQIWPSSFYNCDNLYTVTCEATTPPELDEHGNFDLTGDILYVPSGSEASYKADSSGWNAKFSYIFPIGYEPAVIRYNAGTQATGNWVDNNTITALNTFDALTGDGVLYLNDNVTTIGGGESTDYSPFYQKADLVSVDLSDSGISTVGVRAFYDCSTLVSANIDGVSGEIMGRAFNGCKALTSIDIPSGVTIIGLSAFENCTSLEAIDIPDTVTQIGTSTFGSCTKLISVTVRATTPPTLNSGNFNTNNNTLYVPESAFNAYTSDSSWNGAFTNISVITDDKVISYKATTQASGNWVTTNTDTASNKFNNDRGVLYLNSGVTSIGGEDSTDNSPFYNKTDVVSIDITDTSINTIAKSAFMGCTSLTSISLDNGVLTEIAINGIRGCTILPSVTIPNTVTTLGDNVFRSNKAMTTANIPSGVTSIPDNAFNECQSLASIDIPDTVTSIGVSAFEGCQRLKSITIGTGVTSIGRGAFHAYYPLEVDVYCKATTPPTLDSSNAFAFNYAQDTLHVPASSWDAYCNNSTWNGAFNHIKIIGETKYMAYKSTSQISNSNTWVTNHTTTSKNKWNSTGKRGLLYVTNTSIGGGDSATYSPFYNVKTAIQNVDFSGAFPNVVIGSNVFQNCTSLVNVRLDPTVTQLRPSSFYGCTGLTKLLLPSTINEVANSATNGCSNLKTVWCYATSVPTLGTSNFTASSDTLYVPSASLNSYKNNSAWNSAFTTKSAFLQWW